MHECSLALFKTTFKITESASDHVWWQKLKSDFIFDMLLIEE